ncbi:MAG: hypothetical protein ABSH32_32545 [Bryobacteraceae bacterium]
MNARRYNVGQSFPAAALHIAALPSPQWRSPWQLSPVDGGAPASSTLAPPDMSN